MIGDFFLCYFETTRRCVLSCPYCMTRLPGPSPAPELTSDEAKHLVLDEVRKYSKRAAVAFSGGEFLLRDDAMDLLSYNAGLGMWSFVNTCGVGLTGELIGEIKAATRDKAVLVFSLDSLHQQDGAVSREGRLATVQANTQQCKELGVPHFFIVTITKSNMAEMEEVIEYATRDETPVLRSPMVPRGAGADYRHLMFDRQDMEDVIHPLLRSTYLSYISFTPFFAAPRLFQKNWLQASIAIRQLGCQAGRGYIGVSAEGDVAPCVHLLDTSVTCGNVRQTPLSEILEHSGILKALRTRDDLKGKCGRCKYKDTCGGCRALAYYHSGDYLAEDPTCFFEPSDERARSEHEAEQNRNLGTFARFVTSRSPWKEIFCS